MATVHRITPPIRVVAPNDDTEAPDGVPVEEFPIHEAITRKIPDPSWSDSSRPTSQPLAAPNTTGATEQPRNFLNPTLPPMTLPKSSRLSTSFNTKLLVVAGFVAVSVGIGLLLSWKTGAKPVVNSPRPSTAPPTTEALPAPSAASGESAALRPVTGTSPQVVPPAAAARPSSAEISPPPAQTIAVPRSASSATQGSPPHRTLKRGQRAQVAKPVGDGPSPGPEKPKADPNPTAIYPQGPPPPPVQIKKKPLPWDNDSPVPPQ